MTTNGEPTVTVSMARKINLGNYESADCFVSISGVKVDTTPEEMDALLETGKVAWEKVAGALRAEVRKINEQRATGEYK